MRPISIQKASYWHEPFQPEKLARSLERSGATAQQVDVVLRQLTASLRRGTTTEAIATQVAAALDSLDRTVAARYRLRRAIMELGPEGYPFERYAAKIFSAYGFTTTTNQHVPGRCITHEVDVIAEQGRRRLMIECKYHNRRGVQSDAKVTLYTWARFEDIRDRGAMTHGGGTAFTEGWLVTNTKITSDALTFARCVGLHVLGWHQPPELPLQRLIEAAGLYPITCLPRIDRQLTRRLLQANLLLCQDLAGNPAALRTLGVSETLAAQLALDARQVVGDQPTVPPPLQL